MFDSYQDPHMGFEPNPSWYREVDLGLIPIWYPFCCFVSMKARMVFDRSPSSLRFYVFGPYTSIS